MTTYELAFDEDGEPFAVPPEVRGWRVRRALDGRGRPALVHGRGKAKGKPLIIAVDASHADLLAAAGPGKYRLEPVDAQAHRIDGLPAGCTGPLTDEDDDSDDHDDGDDSHDDSPRDERPRDGRRGAGNETVIAELLVQNRRVVDACSRMAERTVGQLGNVMAGVARLLDAAHTSGITTRPAPAVHVGPPLPPYQGPYEEEDDDEEEEDDDDEEQEVSDERSEPVAPSAIPELVQYIIKETIAKAVPLIFEKLATPGASVGGLPLEALFDWRKAVPTAPASPAASTVATPQPSATAAAGVPDTAPAFVVEAPPVASTWAVSPSVRVGAAPSDQPSPGAPAPMSATPAESSPATEDDAATLLNAHITAVWRGLSPNDRARASLLITRLDADARAALLAELARLSVPDAITRARAVIDAQPPPVPLLPTATP